MSDIPSSPADDVPDLREVRDRYVALSLLDEAALIDPPPVSLGNLVAFLSGNFSLSDLQQQFLFSNPHLLGEFRALVENYSVLRRGRTAQPVKAEEPDNVQHLPLRAAASDGNPLRDWIFPGGSMRIHDFGENDKLLTISLDQSWIQAPSRLLLEQRDRRLAIVNLADPEPGFASGINIVLSKINPEQAQQLEIMQSPTCTGTFLQ
jgi:hypothetical protein